MNSIEEINKIIQGKILQFANNNIVSELLIDSRLLLFPTKTAFFAIKTKRNDGHLFIEDLYQKNVRIFIITEKNFSIQNFPEATFILVQNTVEALQKLAIQHRKSLKGQIVGITGSNGKTIVKEWSKQIIESFLSITTSPKSYNSQIGVPLSVWQAKPNDAVAIFEAGISQLTEMQKLEKIIQPNIGIFTNIGSAHNENFNSIEQKLSEKLQLFEHCHTLIYCSDQELVNKEIQSFTKNKNIRLFSWGHHQEDDLMITNSILIHSDTLLQCNYQNRNFEIKAPFTDQASVENIMHCIALSLLLGIDIHKITEQIAKLKSVALRLELHKGINKCILINDSYNLDLDSLRIALDFLQQQSIYTKKTLILSDIPQTGKDEKDLYHFVSEIVKEKEIYRFIGIGQELIKQKDFFPKNSLFFEDTPSMIEKISEINFDEEAILLKGARNFHFENINNFLQKLTHETVLEINLSALIHNLNYYQLQVKSTKMMAMVKAFAYGSGSTEIANILQYHNVDYLCVAYIDEGIELRKAGIQLPIMIMNPEPAGFEDIIRFNLEPEIYNFKTLNLLEELLNNNLFYRDGVVRFHIKFDTGMHRLGFEEKEMDKLISKILQLKNCRVQSVFSHFACSDDPSLIEFTKQQLEFFKRMSQKMADALSYPIMRHISNSAAISNVPEARFDMVRLGIGLYGISSNPEDQNHLEVVNSLFSVISQIKELPENTYIGYSQGFKTQRKSRIATIPIGYADGLHRSLKNRGEVFINNTFCPLVGNICMDMCMADVTDVKCSEGDKVEIFGKNNPISKIAEQAQTIPYELFTGISPRVKRVYIQE